jgi:hypothetical protein
MLRENPTNVLSERQVLFFGLFFQSLVRFVINS